MPTPLAHGVAGFAVARTVRIGWAASFKLFAVAFIIAQLPDLDFIPGMFLPVVGTFHRGPTHSLVGAALVAVALAAVLVRIGPWVLGGRDGNAPRPGFGAWYGFALAIYLSHLVLDLLSLDTVGNPGLKLWWPFSSAWVSTPAPMPAALQQFFNLEFGPTAGEFFATFFSLRAAAVYLIEAAVFAPLLLVPALIQWVRARAGRRPAAAKPAVERGRPGLLEGAEA